jgi:hypothetical protein
VEAGEGSRTKGDEDDDGGGKAKQSSGSSNSKKQKKKDKRKDRYKDSGGGGGSDDDGGGGGGSALPGVEAKAHHDRMERSTHEVACAVRAGAAILVRRCRLTL